MIKMKLIILFTRLYQMVQSPKFTLHLCIDLDNSTIIFFALFWKQVFVKKQAKQSQNALSFTSVQNFQAWANCTSTCSLQLHGTNKFRF